MIIIKAVSSCNVNYYYNVICSMQNDFLPIMNDFQQTTS